MDGCWPLLMLSACSRTDDRMQGANLLQSDAVAFAAGGDR